MAKSEQEPSVAIIGSGFSGICTTIQIKKQLGWDNITVFDKNSSVGGTWQENTYPGVACDVPSHLYSFSFAPNPNWSAKFSPQSEIKAYLEDVAIKNDVIRHVKFNTEILTANWDDEAQVWSLRYRTKNPDGTITEGTSTFKYVISAVGQLNRPKSIKGIENYKGHFFHSAFWEHEYDLKGKTVAVIGTGPSAVQFVPPLVEASKKVYLFQRSPGWMIPRNDYKYSTISKFIFRYVPFAQRIYRYAFFLFSEFLFLAFKPGSFVGKLVQKKALAYLHKTIKDPELRQKLTPNYPIGCKRLLISDNYYQSLARDNVEVITDRFTFTEKGLSVAGREIEVDCIILGTGFKSLEFLTPMVVTGQNKVALRERWKDGAEAYYGITVSGFPNFMMLYGPNTNLGHNSIIFMIECQVTYIVDLLRNAQRYKLPYFNLKAGVQADFNKKIQGELQKTVFNSDCQSWYKTEDGKITNNWSSYVTKYWYKIRRANLDDYEPKAQIPTSEKVFGVLKIALLGGLVAVGYAVSQSNNYTTFFSPFLAAQNFIIQKSSEWGIY